jgi:hypothetical protein
VSPVVGSANNSDFAKVGGAFDLGVPQEGNDVARFAYVHYVIDPKFHWVSGFLSSESLLLMAAVGVNRVIGKPGTFDMRVMGAVQACLLLASFWLLLPLLSAMQRVPQFLILAVIVFMFTDVMYVSYLNSFYMDAAGLLFALLTIVLFLRSLRFKRAADRCFFVVALVLLITSKSQHYPLGIVAALFLAWKGHLLAPMRGRVYAAFAAILALAATVLSAKGMPVEYPAYAQYNVIFFEVLPHSMNPARDLAELGLDAADARYIGTHAYAAESGMPDPAFRKKFMRQASYAKLGRFFVIHPQYALLAAETRMAEAGRQRPERGNFDPSAGQPEFAESKSFGLWSGLKSAIFHEHGGRYLLYGILLAAIATLLAMARRASLPRGIPAGVGALAAMSLLEMAVASFGDALDAARHFVVFSAMSDVLSIAVVWLLCAALERRFVSSRPESLRGESR